MDLSQSSARHVAGGLENIDLYNALHGNFVAVQEDKPIAEASSKVFWLNPSSRSFRTWQDRSFYSPSLKLTPIAVVELTEELEKAVNELRTLAFEDYAFYRTAIELECKPEAQGLRSQRTAAAYERIKELRNSEKELFRPNSPIFPLVDFLKTTLSPERI